MVYWGEVLVEGGVGVSECDMIPDRREKEAPLAITADVQLKAPKCGNSIKS